MLVAALFLMTELNQANERKLARLRVDDTRYCKVHSHDQCEAISIGERKRGIGTS